VYLTTPDYDATFITIGVAGRRAAVVARLSTPGDLPDILEAVKTLGLEGVIAKRREIAAACTGYAATMPARL
jgi:hypothetical protein